jgi:hypothetical protein
MSNKPTREQMNESIGIFMGYKMYDKRYPRNHGIGAPEAEPEKCMIIQKAKYHSSWDRLKPVIDEIFKYALAHPEQVKNIINMSIVVDISAAHEKVYQFIQWYNKQQSYEQPPME